MAQLKLDFPERRIFTPLLDVLQKATVVAQDTLLTMTKQTAANGGIGRQVFFFNLCTHHCIATHEILQVKQIQFPCGFDLKPAKDKRYVKIII